VSERIDLHLHSSWSDGMLAPAALVAYAAQHGVRVLALTDHDTVAGLAEAAGAARDLGLYLVPGVELSATWRGRSVHILGLGIDAANGELASLLADLQAMRGRRARAIAQRLDAAGAPGSAALERLGSRAIITRAHIARELVALGAVRAPGDAFRRWLGQGQRAQVAAPWPVLADVVQAIAAAGGLAALAHPLRYRLSAGQRRTLLADFAAAGGAAVEVVTGQQMAGDTATAAGLALRAGLLGSQGSDFHDPALPWQRPGRLAKLPEAVAPIWQRWEAGMEAALDGATLDA
jgi:3',5'-nucleoside bisphosphate phosphatase